MKSFISTHEQRPTTVYSDHGGIGSIEFRRLLEAHDFLSNVDFVDVSVIPPGCTFGPHKHVDNEELYCILRGEPLVRVDGFEQRLTRGDIAVVRSGQWHELVNDTQDEVEIFVIQVRQ